MNRDPERVDTSILRRSIAANSVVSGVILPKFKLILTFMHVLTCENDEDPVKNEGARVATTSLTLYVNGDFSRCI